MQRPGVGVIFERAGRLLRQVDKAGLDKAQQRRAAQPAAHKVERRQHGARRGGVFRRCGFVAEQRNALQAEFVADGRQIGRCVAADDRHAVVGRPGARAGAHGGGHCFGLRLAVVRFIKGDGRAAGRSGVNGLLRRVTGVRQQQRQFGQRRGPAVAQVLGQLHGMGLDARLCRHRLERRGDLPRAAEHAEAAVTLLQAVAAQADRHIGRGQHGRQQRALGGVEGIEFIHVYGAPGKKLRAAARFLQAAGGQLLPVAGVHAGLGQQALIRAVDQGQLAELVGIGPGGAGIAREFVGADAGAFELLDGLGRLAAERRALALAAVVGDLVQQLVQRAAHEHGAPGFGQGGHRRAAVAPQQRFGQRRKRVAFDIAGQRIAQRAVERAFGGGGELFRHDEDAVQPGLGTGLEFAPQAAGFSAAGGAKK